MAVCTECHKAVRGELRASMESEPVISADAVSGGGLLVVDVGIRLVCPHDEALLAYRCMELEELFEHRCRERLPGWYTLLHAGARPTDQTILRPDKRSSRRWLGADVTIALQCPHCHAPIKVAVTVGDYALEFLTAA